MASLQHTRGWHRHNKLATVSVLEDDLVVGEEQLRHDVGVLPVQPQGALCRGHDPALLQPAHTYTHTVVLHGLSFFGKSVNRELLT